jgi:hypothetical protein
MPEPAPNPEPAPKPTSSHDAVRHAMAATPLGGLDVSPAIREALARLGHKTIADVCRFSAEAIVCGRRPGITPVQMEAIEEALDDFEDVVASEWRLANGGPAEPFDPNLRSEADDE